MSTEYAQRLYEAGKAHAVSACLLRHAAVELAKEDEHSDPDQYAFNGPYSLSIPMLLGLGLELMLKAAIIACNPSRDEKYLRTKLGHDLTAALNEAERSGFSSEAGERLRQLVDVLSKPYDEHWFRYDLPTSMPLPSDFDQIVEVLTVIDGEVLATLNGMVKGCGNRTG
jgi:hypothetical protein